MLENLEFKEKRAIELRYLGYSYPDIAVELDMSLNTLKEWFSSNGKLFAPYNTYLATMNKERDQQMLENLKMTDNEVFTITTNIGRKLGQRLQGKQVPITNKDGEVQKDKEGNVLYREVGYNPTVGDFVDAWKIQRIMQGLPVTHDKTEINNTQINVSMDVIIEKLGLIEDDFLEENYGKTLVRISDYLRQSRSS